MQKNEVGWDKKNKRQNGWDLRKETAVQWVNKREKRAKCTERKSRAERSKEMKRAGVLLIQMPLYWSSYKRQRLRRNKKGGCALPNHSLYFNAFNSSLFSFIFLLFIAPKANDHRCMVDKQCTQVNANERKCIRTLYKAE